MGTFAREIVDIYPYKQYAYDGDGNLVYLGEHKTLNESDDSTDWVVYKFEYTSGNLVMKRKRITSWTDKDSGWS